MTMQWIIENDSVGMRLDIFLLTKFVDKSRSSIKHLIDDSTILINGKNVKAGYILRINDVVDVGEIQEKVLSSQPQDLPIDVVYEDDDLAVINKKQGMVVHPAVKNYDNTLVNALMFRLKNLSSINGTVRPGIVHRIDKDTSGLLVVAKNDFAHVNLSKQIANKECRRVYWALCDGRVSGDGEIVTSIGRHPKNRLKMAVVDGGKLAHTLYKVLKIFNGYSLVEFELKTGRTHQIRVHSAHLNHPIVGDKLYNYNKSKFSLDGQLLHAKKLIFNHPRTGKEMVFESQLPEHFQKILNILDNELK